jgi:2-methylcitrate dehydratase PrpD
LSAVSPEGKVDRESPPRALGSRWKIIDERLSIKKYPACYCTHRSLDALLELLARRPLQAEEIAEITVGLSDTHALILRNHSPQTGLAAKFSIEFAMAAAVIARRAGLAEYTDSFVTRPEVQALMRRVEVETNRNYDPDGLGGSVFDEVRVRLASGEIVESEKVRYARGHGNRPLSEAELFEKFRSCLDLGGAQIAPQTLFDRLKSLERLSARELTALP